MTTKIFGSPGDDTPKPQQQEGQTDTPPSKLKTYFPAATMLLNSVVGIKNRVAQKATELLSRPEGSSPDPSDNPTVRLTAEGGGLLQTDDRFTQSGQLKQFKVQPYQEEDREEDPAWLALIKERPEYMEGLRLCEVDVPSLLAMDVVDGEIESYLMNLMSDSENLKKRLSLSSKRPNDMIAAINQLTTDGLQLASSTAPTVNLDTAQKTQIESQYIQPAVTFGNMLWRLKERLEAQGFSFWVTISDQDDPAKEKIVVAGSVDREWQSTSYGKFIEWLSGNYKFPIPFDAETILEKAEYPSIVGTVLASQMALDSTGQKTLSFLVAEDIHDQTNVPFKVQRNTRLYTEGDKMEDDGKTLKESGTKTIGPFVCIPFIFQIHGRTVKFVVQFFIETYDTEISGLRQSLPEFFTWDAGKRSEYLCKKGYMKPFRRRDVLGLIKAFYQFQPTIATYIEQCIRPQLNNTIQTIREAQAANQHQQLFFRSCSGISGIAGNLNMLEASTTPFVDKNQKNVEIKDPLVLATLRQLEAIEKALKMGNSAEAGKILSEVKQQMIEIDKRLSILEDENQQLHPTLTMEVDQTDDFRTHLSTNPDYDRLKTIVAQQASTAETNPGHDEFATLVSEDLSDET